MPIALGTDFFSHGPLNSIVTLQPRPRLIKRIRVLDPDAHLQSLAVISQLDALHDVQLLGMRRAEIVDEALVVHSDGVDHERVAAFIMANRLAVPGWLWTL